MDKSNHSQKDHLRHQGDEAHLLREIVRTHQTLMAGFSRAIGLPASRLALMRLLAVTPGDLGVMDISRQLGINAAAVTRQVKDLEKDGLVRRRADLRDKRRHYISLSPKGIKIFETLHDRSHELEQALSSVISAQEIATSVAVLHKLRIFIEELTK